MQIVQLEAENIKRLHAVRIRPDGAIVQITGKNGEGKSSVLDAIAYGLAGERGIPAKPIREGAEEAKIVVDLGDLTVTRRWTKAGKTYLSVEGKGGAKSSSPQKLLDSLVGELTFDPLAFSRMAPRDQVATLKGVAKLDFSAQDKRRSEVFDERTGINRQHKSVLTKVLKPQKNWTASLMEKSNATLARI